MLDYDSHIWIQKYFMAPIIKGPMIEGIHIVDTAVPLYPKIGGDGPPGFTV